MKRNFNWGDGNQVKNNHQIVNKPELCCRTKLYTEYCQEKGAAPPPSSDRLMFQLMANSRQIIFSLSKMVRFQMSISTLQAALRNLWFVNLYSGYSLQKVAGRDCYLNGTGQRKLLWVMRIQFKVVIGLIHGYHLFLLRFQFTGMNRYYISMGKPCIL